ncbi:MAG: CNP1-like family protein [Ramlibacter sp.]|nr:CNP1-like family protein [Ramlibacter sp.]
MRLDRFFALALSIAGFTAHAQLAPIDPDWREVEAPPAPAFSAEGLIALDTPRSALRFGVAPASVALGSDGIVRYVVVATAPSGAVNAMYEGIRCKTGEYKVYARHNPGSGWVIAKDPQWLPLQSAPMPRHALTIARTGACVGHGTASSTAKIVSDLRAPVARFDQPQ